MFGFEVGDIGLLGIYIRRLKINGLRLPGEIAGKPEAVGSVGYSYDWVPKSNGLTVLADDDLPVLCGGDHGIALFDAAIQQFL